MNRVLAMLRRISFLLVLLLLTSFPAFAQDLPSIEAKTKGLEKMEGFYTIYWDETAGKVWLEIDRFN